MDGRRNNRQDLSMPCQTRQCHCLVLAPQIAFVAPPPSALPTAPARTTVAAATPEATARPAAAVTIRAMALRRAEPRSAPIGMTSTTPPTSVPCLSADLLDPGDGEGRLGTGEGRPHPRSDTAAGRLRLAQTRHPDQTSVGQAACRLSDRLSRTGQRRNISALRGISINFKRLSLWPGPCTSVVTAPRKI